MHIPDGFLATRAWAPLAVMSAAAIGTSVNRVRRDFSDRDVPMMGITSAFIFAAQMLNFPIAGGTSGHFMGGVLAALMLGPWAGTLILASVLIIQCLIFQDGGLLALGANIFNMGIVGVWSGWLIYRFFNGLKLNNRISVFCASWISIVIAASACAIELSLSGTIRLSMALPAMAGVHVLIGIGEGLITLAVVEMVARVRPDIAAAGGAVNS